jgi:nitrogen regulatory protein PII
MYALVIILNNIEYLQEVLGTLRKSGIRGATVLDGMGSKGNKNMELNTNSFLASIVESLDQRAKSKKIVLSVVERDDQVKKAMEAVNQLVNVDGTHECGAVMMTLPVNHMRGGELERHIKRREAKQNMESDQQ